MYTSIRRFDIMKRIVPGFFLILFVFSSCKKGKADFTLTGVITDQTFNSPLSGATVNLYATTAGGSSTDLIAQTTVGSDGAYSLTFPRDQVETYYLEVLKDNYFGLYKSIPFSSLTIKEDNVRSYGTTAKSWVRLRFINNSPQASDVLQYIKQEGKEGCDECCVDTDQFLNGAVDTSIYCINDGNTTYSYFYWVHNSTNQGMKSVVTVPFDTVDLVLTY